MGGDGFPLGLGLHQFLEDQLVDAAVVHIHDLDLESADLRYPNGFAVKMPEYQASTATANKL